MNLLFLSLTPHTVAALHGGASKRNEGAALALLDEICGEANAQVVLCSPAQCAEDSAALNDFFVKQGSQHIRVIGTTKQTESAHQGYQVMMFLQHFGREVENYVVLDNAGDYFVWQPLIRIPADRLNREVGYEVLRQLHPQSKLLAQWEADYGLGNLLSLVDPPQKQA